MPPVGGASIVGSKSHGIAFLVAYYGVFEVYSALNSSPWTIETVGADPDMAAAARRRVRQAIVNSIAAGVFASWLDGNWWPLIGTLAADAYMLWVYEDAIHRAEAKAADSTNGNSGRGWF